MKFFLTALGLACFLFSCVQSTSTIPIETKQNEQLIKNYYNYFNRHQWDKMAQLYVEKATFKDPSFGIHEVQQTRAQIIEKYQALSVVFPDIKDDIQQIYVSGNHVTVEFVSTGTGTDGKKFTLPICTVFTIENSKIIQDNTYYDNFEE